MSKSWSVKSVNIYRQKEMPTFPVNQFDLWVMETQRYNVIDKKLISGFEYHIFFDNRWEFFGWSESDLLDE